MDCIIEYQKSPHLNILYEGLSRLDKDGIIKMNIKYGMPPLVKGAPLLKVFFNGKQIIFDNLDGLNWVQGTIDENLDFFHSELDCDFFFKRSFDPILMMENNRKRIFPLGLYFYINSTEVQNINAFIDVKGYLKNSNILRCLTGKPSNHFPLDLFEQVPNLFNKSKQLIFSVRLWNPNTAKSEQTKSQREEINDFRIRCVEFCKKEYGNSFIGGISRDSFSEKILSNDLLVPNSFSQRKNYLQLVKKSSIGIATTGLHNSIGGKFGEYVAASKAIVTEKLNYKLPGHFNNSDNYLEFNSLDELGGAIDRLFSDEAALKRMQLANYSYYQQYSRPDVLVLNALQKTIENLD